MGLRKYIATRLHQALDMAPDDEALRAMTEAPHYVVDSRLIEMFFREDITKSIAALIEAGIFRLPFPELLVEFEVGGPVRRFIHIHERGDGFDCICAALNGPALTVTQKAVRVDVSRDPMCFRADGEMSSELDRMACVFAVSVAMLMLNTQGVEKEVLDATPLNKAREVRGQAAIPRHTLLRIGTVVNAKGERVSFGDCRHMPLHLRAGHVRHQAYGKGRNERKLIYIPPTLVNFRPEHASEPVALPMRVLTR